MLQCISRTSGTVIDTRPLTITIGHPWWSSWWMWCVYAVLLLLAFYGAWRVYELHEKYMRLTIDHLQTVETTPLQQWQEKENSSRLASEPPVETSETSEAGKDFVDKASKLIVEHLSDSEFTIDRLCREMAMSRTLFYVKLKSYTGKSPQDFIRIIRLERAATLLRNGHTVTDAASLAGFDNPKYFSTVFKKYFGVSPSKYQ
jgi:AraC-like DNA-binding protein